MLQIIKTFPMMDTKQVLEVYSESILQAAKEDAADLPCGLRIVKAEQNFLTYLGEFFRSPDAIMGVWEVDGMYKAVLRVEPYRDGWLITGLETASADRRCGYGKQLVKSILYYLREKGKVKVYSHVNKQNVASLSLHIACGFCKISDHAVYLDGSVYTSSCTLCYEL